MLAERLGRTALGLGAFERELRTDVRILQRLHYKGLSPALTDLLAGTVQLMFSTCTMSTPAIEAKITAASCDELPLPFDA